MIYIYHINFNQRNTGIDMTNIKTQDFKENSIARNEKFYDWEVSLSCLT